MVYLGSRAAWDELPSFPRRARTLPIGGTSLQLVLVLIAFFDVPSGYRHGVSAGPGAPSSACSPRSRRPARSSSPPFAPTWRASRPRRPRFQVSPRSPAAIAPGATSHWSLPSRFIGPVAPPLSSDRVFFMVTSSMGIYPLRPPRGDRAISRVLSRTHAVAFYLTVLVIVTVGRLARAPGEPAADGSAAGQTAQVGATERTPASAGRGNSTCSAR